MTTTPNTFEALRALRAALTDDHGVDRKLADVVITSIQRIGERDADIATQGARLVDRIQRTMDAVARGEHINGLGELQGSAPSFDIACARRMDAVEAASHVIYTLPTDAAKDAARAIAFPGAGE